MIGRVWLAGAGGWGGGGGGGGGKTGSAPRSGRQDGQETAAKWAWPKVAGLAVSCSQMILVPSPSCLL